MWWFVKYMQPSVFINKCLECVCFLKGGGGQTRPKNPWPAKKKEKKKGITKSLIFEMKVK